jgi:hypothetical protein
MEGGEQDMSLEAQLAEVRQIVQHAVKAVDDLAEAVESQTTEQVDVNSNPEVQRAAVALAQAIARAQGVDLPLQAAEGFGELPVMVLPEEFQKFGGIGIGVMYAPPTDAATSA